MAGRHLAPGHPKDREDPDPDPLKSQGKNPGLSHVLLTDLTRSQRKANTDNVNIFYDAVTYWKCGFVFVPEQSVKKNKKAFLIFFFFGECTCLLTSIGICRPVIVLYCTKYLHRDYFPNETFLCLEVSSEMCVTDLLAVVIFCFRML